MAHPIWLVKGSGISDVLDQRPGMQKTRSQKGGIFKKEEVKADFGQGHGGETAPFMTPEGRGGNQHKPISRPGGVGVLYFSYLRAGVLKKRSSERGPRVNFKVQSLTIAKNV